MASKKAALQMPLDVASGKYSQSLENDMKNLQTLRRILASEHVKGLWNKVCDSCPAIDRLAAEAVTRTNPWLSLLHDRFSICP